MTTHAPTVPPLSAKQARLIWDSCMTGSARMFDNDEASALAAIRDGQHVVVRVLSKAEAREAFEKTMYTDANQNPLEYASWLAALRSIGAVR